MIKQAVTVGAEHTVSHQNTEQRTDTESQQFSESSCCQSQGQYHKQKPRQAVSSEVLGRTIATKFARFTSSLNMLCVARADNGVRCRLSHQNSLVVPSGATLPKSKAARPSSCVRAVCVLHSKTGSCCRCCGGCCASTTEHHLDPGHHHTSLQSSTADR